MSRSSSVTQRYPEEEKISWNIAGEDAESLNEILLGKSDYLISGILAEDPLATTSLMFVIARSSQKRKK